MAFTPWLKHDVVEGWCLGCSRKIPHAAVIREDERFIAYSHGGIFSPNPQGNVVRCTDKSP